MSARASTIDKDSSAAGIAALVVALTRVCDTGCSSSVGAMSLSSDTRPPGREVRGVETRVGRAADALRMMGISIPKKSLLGKEFVCLGVRIFGFTRNAIA
jgi:hypothetical protein